MCLIYVFESKKIKSFTQKGRMVCFKVPAQKRSAWPTLNVVMATELCSDMNKLTALANHRREKSFLVECQFNTLKHPTGVSFHPERKSRFLCTGSIKCDRAHWSASICKSSFISGMFSSSHYNTDWRDLPQNCYWIKFWNSKIQISTLFLFKHILEEPVCCLASCFYILSDSSSFLFKMDSYNILFESHLSETIAYQSMESPANRRWAAVFYSWNCGFSPVACQPLLFCLFFVMVYSLATVKVFFSS